MQCMRGHFKNVWTLHTMNLFCRFLLRKTRPLSEINTLAWCRSTPYMASFLAFSRNNMSAWAGLIDLEERKTYLGTCVEMSPQCQGRVKISEQEGKGVIVLLHCLPVCAVQLHHLLLQLFALPRSQIQVLHVVRPVDLWVVLAQLGLGGVWPQQGQRDEGTGQDAAHNVLPQLETQEVSRRWGRMMTIQNLDSGIESAFSTRDYGNPLPGEVLSQLGWIWRVKLHTEHKLVHRTRDLLPEFFGGFQPGLGKIRAKRKGYHPTFQTHFVWAWDASYLVGGWIPVCEAKIVLLHQVEVVAHLGQKVLALCMFLHGEDTQTHTHEGL